jgi:alpha-galactosidase
VPNYGALQGLPDDVAVEVPAVVNVKGIQPLRVTQLPKKIMLEKILPPWLRMEQNLEALKSGDMTMQLWGVLQGRGVRSYEHAVETMEAILALPPTEPMAHIEAFEDHYKWPDIWSLPS